MGNLLEKVNVYSLTFGTIGTGLEEIQDKFLTTSKTSMTTY
jgi:hypothetical protein